MADDPDPRPKEGAIPLSDAPHAPFIFYEKAPAFGVTNGVINVNRRPKLTHYRRPILTRLGAAIEGLDWGIGEGEQAARERALR
jgi:hypothetical protein